MQKTFARLFSLTPAQRLVVALASIVSIMFIGIGGYTLLEGWNLIDSFFMTVITLSTVGYGEVKPLSMRGRLFTSGLIIMGATLVAIVLASITQMLFEGSIKEIFGRKRMEKEIQGLKNHYIICGYGRTGRVISSEFLRKKVPFIVVETDAQKVASLLEKDILAILGNAEDEEVLKKAGIEKARGLICATPKDAQNVFITITARALNKDLYILSRAEEEGSEQKLYQVGANKVVCPHHIGGLRMAQAVLQPAVVDFIEIGTHRQHLGLYMEEVMVQEGSELDHKPLKDTKVRKELGLIVIAIKRADGEMLFNPPADTPLDPGDKIVVMGDIDKIQKLMEMASSSVKNHH